MDAEEIQKKLPQLSRANFKRVVHLILNRILNYSAINVDGSGDGGSDWIVLQQDGLRLKLAIQDTVQVQGWESKALEDAKKAKQELAINRYIFFTNRPHQQATVTQLEDKITRETGLSCAIFEGRRISELIHDKGFGNQFLGVINNDITLTKPLEMPEICLCTYGNLSADRQNHRDEIYRDTLLIACHEANRSLKRSEIVDDALKFLGTTDVQRPLLDRQFERLLSKEQLRKTVDGGFELTPETKKRLYESEQLYLADWTGLESTLPQVVKAHNASVPWTTDDSRQATVFVARMFLLQQFELLRHAKVDNLLTNWSARLGNPEQQLRDLLQQRGVPLPKIRVAIEEFVNIAKGRDVISKLTRTITFVALEGRDPMLSAAALGRRTWQEVNVLIDSSVAIPFLCEQLHEASSTYHFSLSGNAVRLFQSLSSSCRMIAGHVEECAAHLIQAYRYKPIESDRHLASALRLSENAFIAYYGALKAEGRANDHNLAQFLSSFSKRAGFASQQNSDIRQSARTVMPDLQDLLNHYKVPHITARQTAVDRFGTLQKAFDNGCLETGRERPAILREHDVEALGHLANSTEQKSESWMMLTWDKTLIKVANIELTSAFVVSPEMAMDFAQPCRQLSDTQWCALAHRLAKITSPSDELTARILDQVARFSPDKLNDAVFRKHILEFRDQALQTLPTEDEAQFHAAIEGEVQTFLQQQNVSSNRQDIGPSSSAI